MDSRNDSEATAHRSLAERLALDRAARQEFLSALSDDEKRLLEYDWRFWGRPKQQPPPGDWRFWLILAGRGFGKTRTGAQWVIEQVEKQGKRRVALVAETAADARDVMVEGEALALDTPIPTPNGWVDFGDLKSGDSVFAGDGTVTSVVAVTPVWAGLQCHALVADGAEPIVASANHRWVTRTRAERRPGRKTLGSGIRTTTQILDTLKWRRSDLLEHEIPIHGALQLAEAALPLDPYVLGAWLGDGDTRGHGQFTCHDDDAATVDQIRSRGFVVVKRVGSYAWGIRGLTTKLRALGLIGNKQIPVEYLRGSTAQRLDLLRGLMDTDGYVSARGQCSFDNTNRTLVEQTRELALTLGFKPGAIQTKVDKRGHLPMHRIVFTCTTVTPVPFALPRKAARCVRAKMPGGRLVRSAQLVASVPVRCIQVAHESGTFLAGRDMVVTHNSGILACSPPWFKPRYEPTKRRLTWPNGAVATTYSADEPDQLRGPQSDCAWADELAKWMYAEAWDQLCFGLRLGNNPRCIITTTPKPTPIIKALVRDQLCHTTRGNTAENRANVAPQWLDSILRKYEGTRLGRQELNAEILDDAPGALWKREIIDEHRVSKHPDLIRIVVAVDPSVSSESEDATTGIVVAGLGDDGHGYLLADGSMIRPTPEQWGSQTVSLYNLHQADRVIGEVNNGGDLVEANVRACSATVSFKQVRASRGKAIRAEPVAALAEQGRIHHVGSFAVLEDELCQWEPGVSTWSPNRLDAKVWAFTELMIGDEQADDVSVFRIKSNRR